MSCCFVTETYTTDRPHLKTPGEELTFAASDMESQLPPDRENFPLPIRARISSGVSSGPLAKGVNLREI